MSATGKASYVIYQTLKINQKYTKKHQQHKYSWMVQWLIVLCFVLMVFLCLSMLLLYWQCVFGITVILKDEAVANQTLMVLHVGSFFITFLHSKFHQFWEDLPTQLTEMQPQTASSVYTDNDFNQMWIHQTSCHWFSIQLLCNLPNLSPFFLFSFLKNGFWQPFYLYTRIISDDASLNRRWINWSISPVLC